MNWLGKLVCVGVLMQSFQFLHRMYFIVVRRFAEIKERNQKKLKFHMFVSIPLKDLQECKFYQDSKRH